MLNMTPTKKDAELIEQIADRAVQEYARSGVFIKKDSTINDLTICHLNGCPLRLKAMLDGLAYHLIHDINGLAANLDYATGTLKSGFRPRYAKPTKKEE